MAGTDFALIFEKTPMNWGPAGASTAMLRAD